MFLGTAVHDTSQVMGAALTYKQVYDDDVVLRVATVTKLTRNIFLAVVIPVLTWMHMRSNAADRIGRHRRRDARSCPASWSVSSAMAVVRSIGDATLTSNGAAFGVWSAAQWASITKELGDFWASQVLLGTAMAAVGLNTNFAVFKGVGLKPFAVGMAGALVVGAVGMGMAVHLRAVRSPLDQRVLRARALRRMRDYWSCELACGTSTRRTQRSIHRRVDLAATAHGSRWP